MFSYILRRLLMLIPVLIGMTLITFSIVHLIPGNPAQVILGETATANAITELEESMGLNEPYFVQYGHYLMDLTQGDLGTSLRSKAE
ncbi:ABC transporter permease, partial [Staphylococcus sp. SIMBA_130]